MQESGLMQGVYAQAGRQKTRASRDAQYCINGLPGERSVYKAEIGGPEASAEEKRTSGAGRQV